MAANPASPALVLLGHGARDPEWRRPIDAVLAGVQRRCPDMRCAVAFHEFIGPNLEETIGALHADGCRQIIVLPVFIAQGGHLRHEVPAQVEALRRRFPDCRISLQAAVGEAPVVQDAIASHCAGLLSGNT